MKSRCDSRHHSVYEKGSAALPSGVKVQQQTVNIAGLEVTGFASVESCAEYIHAKMRRGEGGAAFAINAEKVVTYRADPEVRDLLRQGTLRYPDGAGVVLTMKKRGAKTARVPGADLWLAVLRSAAPHTITAALIGARSDVLAETVRKIGTEMSHVKIVFAADGFDGVADLASVANSIALATPDLVLVAMGSPRQEQIILELHDHWPSGYFMGLGGSFDVYCGRKRRAPLWMQHIGLEWFFRFLAEPSRAGRELKRLRFLALLMTGQV